MQVRPKGGLRDANPSRIRGYVSAFARLAAAAKPTGRATHGLTVLLLGGFVLSRLPVVHAESPSPGVIDLHVDLSYQVNYKGQTIAAGSGQYESRWLRQAGIAGVVLPLYIPRDVSATGPRMVDLEQSFSAMRRLLPSVGTYASDFCSASGSSTGFQFAFEGAEPLGWELDSATRWAGRGVRLFGLVHAYDNALASSSGERGARFGLSRRGAELLRRVHAVGGIADVSHASDAAVQDILAQADAAGRPVVATHSNSRALAPHPRNLTDAQLRGIARSGGIIGVNFHSRFLLGGAGIAQLSDVVRHVLHVAKVAGIEHVAIGSDFEGGISPPRQLQDIRGFPVLARALADAGMTREAVVRLFGANARRVLCSPRAPPR